MTTQYLQIPHVKGIKRGESSSISPLFIAKRTLLNYKNNKAKKRLFLCFRSNLFVDTIKFVKNDLGHILSGVFLFKPWRAKLFPDSGHAGLVSEDLPLFIGQTNDLKALLLL
jgi:hypothetical protein